MTVDVSEDIRCFIHQHFNPGDLCSVYEVLRSPPLCTPRVARAALYLSNGSLSLLRHYASRCADDVGSVLIDAEYLAGVSEMPMRIRDMSRPFGNDQRELDSGAGITERLRLATRRAKARRSELVENNHRHLANRTFTLGKIEYFITTRQPSRTRVRCMRKEHNAISLVELPLMFVLDQLAERIEITEPMY